MEIKYLSQEVAILEAEPCVRTITHAIYGHMRVSLPYQIFRLYYKKESSYYILYGGNLYFRKEPLVRPYYVYAPYLSNVTTESRICFGVTGLYDRSNRNLVKSAISYFWQSKFNKEASYCQVLYGFSWQDINSRSQQNPEFWKTIDFPFVYELMLPLCNSAEINLLWK